MPHTIGLLYILIVTIRPTNDMVSDLQGLSRLPGNWHGRFLGGGGLVTARCYPTLLKGYLVVVGLASQIGIKLCYRCL